MILSLSYFNDNQLTGNEKWGGHYAIGTNPWITKCSSTLDLFGGVGMFNGKSFAMIWIDISWNYGK